MEMLTNFKFVQNLAHQLIQPRPCNYLALDIWKHINNRELYKYQFTHFDISNDRKISLHLIEYQQQNKQNTQFYPSTCIVYLHGLSSFCVQGSFLVQNLQKYFNDLNLSVCLYDLRGHGKDKAQNVTFGLKQSKQLYQLLLYLKKEKKYQQFILWGRSMGATTILKMVSDFSNDILQNQISIKYLVLDSAFCSVQKVATQIISKKTGMPQIFCKAIFQYLISAIEKIHKLKLAVEINKFPILEINSLFLYSQRDNLVSPEHTKILYEKYQGPKQKMQMNVEHNDARPQSILIQVFLKLKSCLKSELHFQRRRSVSTKKIGLSITKNNRVKTIQSKNQQNDDLLQNVEIQISHNIKTAQKLKQYDIQPRIKVNKQKQNNKQICFMNLNSMKHSPKPFKIAKDYSTNFKTDKKIISLNGTHKNSPKILKQNSSNLNFLKSDYHKKQKKLKLSYKDLVQQDKHKQKDQQKRHRTSIYQNIQQNKNTIQQNTHQQGRKQTSHIDFSQFKQVKSAFLIRNEQQTFYNVSKNLKQSYLTKKYQQNEVINKKLSINQSGSTTPQCCNWTTMKQINSTILKPQSQNINIVIKNRVLKNNIEIGTTSKGILNQQKYINKNISTNIRRSINEQLIKRNSIEINNINNKLKSNFNFNQKPNKQIFINFNHSDQQKSSIIHRLSNQHYV